MPLNRANFHYLKNNFDSLSLPGEPGWHILFQGEIFMPYIDPDIITEAKKMDLLTYLQNYEQHELVHITGDTYTTRTHDSLKISNGKWYWFSRGIGGHTALDYLIKVDEMRFTDAMEQIMGQAAIQPPVFVSKPKQQQKKEFILPQENPNCSRVVKYLIKRGIDRDILHYCIDTFVLYENYPHHNAVFVGMDDIGIPRYAALRGENFMGEAKGSDKRYSFSIPSNQASDTVHLFESPIDVLSYASILKLNGHEWRRDNLLSLSGVYRPKENVTKTATPVALEQFLKEKQHIKNIVLRFDNDETGRLAAKAIQAIMSNDYAVTNKPPLSGKDYNDYLCDRLGIPRNQRKERSENERV